MKTNLLPIYKLRIILLKRANPHFFDRNRRNILRTSLAAQDYVQSGHYYEYDSRRMGVNFKQLPEYVAVHKKYNLPYLPELIVVEQNGVNPGLVMDLSWSLQQDKMHGIVDQKGNIVNAAALPSSEVLQVYHNTSVSGRPIDALKTMKPEQVKELIGLIQQKTR